MYTNIIMLKKWLDYNCFLICDSLIIMLMTLQAIMYSLGFVRWWTAGGISCKSKIKASMVGVSNSFRSYPSRPMFILVAMCT